MTILFGDLVGFTSLSQDRDPEETRALLSRYFEVARTHIETHGGIVEKFIGDAVMAVWGSPTAHEDDAERAVRAGLELVKAVEELGRERGQDDLDMRVGILTGEAAVQFAADGEGMVAGDIVNTASRLQSVAERGSVLVGESTRAAAASAIAFDAGRPYELKGKEEPIAAYRALEVVSGSLGRRRSNEVQPPFVGRNYELRFLKDQLAAVRTEGDARVVSLMGPAGIGKSRLAWEVFKYGDGLVDTTYWHEGRCPSYGEGVTFWALAEMVRTRAEISELDDQETSRKKLDEALARFVADEEERDWLRPAFSTLLGLSSDERTQPEYLFAAWRRFFERLAELAPVVLVYEDIQWADGGLLDFIEHQLQWSRGYPILIITLARPDLLDRRPTWGAGQRNFTSLVLEPLSAEDMRVLLDGLITDAPDEFLRQIVDRAEGTPLYAVEMVRMLLDRGRLERRGDRYALTGEPGPLETPQTLHALIAGRLDSLETEQRLLLQDASVLGKTFAIEALVAVSARDRASVESDLKILVGKEVLTFNDDPRSPERGQYGFVQSVVREVAYQTLARRDRFDRHLRAARHFEDQNAEELASVIVTHYMEAYRAADEDARKNLRPRVEAFLVQATNRAEALGAHDQALTYIEETVKVVDEPARKADLLIRAATIGYSALRMDQAEEWCLQAIETFQSVGDDLGRARAQAKYGEILTAIFRYKEASELLTSTLEPLEEAKDEETVAVVNAALASAATLRNDHQEGMRRSELALQAAAKHDLIEVMASALNAKGLSLFMSGRWREAIVVFDGAITFDERHGLLIQHMRAINNLVWASTLDRPASAMAVAAKGLETARKYGLRYHELLITVSSHLSAYLRGEWGWTQETLVEGAERDSVSAIASEDAALRALIETCRGDVDAVDREIGNAPAPTLEGQELAFDGHARAFLALLRGDDAAVARWVEVARVNDPGAIYPPLAQTLLARAALWRRDPKAAEAAIEGLVALEGHADCFDQMREALVAATAYLDGDDLAIARHRVASQRLDELEAGFAAALARLDVVAAAARPTEAIVDAADLAGSRFQDLGAVRLLEILEDHRIRLGIGSPSSLREIG